MLSEFKRSKDPNWAGKHIHGPRIILAIAFLVSFLTIINIALLAYAKTHDIRDCGYNGNPGCAGFRYSDPWSDSAYVSHHLHHHLPFPSFPFPFLPILSNPIHPFPKPQRHNKTPPPTNARPPQSGQQ